MTSMHIMTPIVTLAKMINPTHIYTKQKHKISPQSLAFNDILTITMLMNLPSVSNPLLTVKEKKTDANCE